MNGFPWLTVAGAMPLLGAIVIALIPGLPADSAEADRQARNALAKYLALAFSLLTLVAVIIIAVKFQVGGPNYQFTESVLVDPGVRRALRARRGRHRAGAHRDDRGADAGGDPGLLERRRWRLGAGGSTRCGDRKPTSR